MVKPVDKTVDQDLEEDFSDLVPAEDLVDDEPKGKVENEEEPKESSFADKVNDVVKDMTQNEDGTWALPEGEYSPELKYAAVAEKRYRDAQSALGKAKHEATTTDSENKELRKKLRGKTQVVMTPEEVEEMESLKFSNPDAWREKMNEFDKRAAKELDTELSEVTEAVSQDGEIARRREVFKQFNTDNPDFQLTEEMLANDIPPRILEKLRDGKTTFEEYLEESVAYLKTGKRVVDEKVNTQPNLSDVGGKEKASEDAVKQDAEDSYENEIF